MYAIRFTGHYLGFALLTKHLRSFVPSSKHITRNAFREQQFYDGSIYLYFCHNHSNSEKISEADSQPSNSTQVKTLKE